MMPPGSKVLTVKRVGNATAQRQRDLLAVEEPLEIRIGVEQAGGRLDSSVAITMRTPGDDFDLAAGFLYCEGIVGARHEIVGIDYGRGPQGENQCNVVCVHLRPDRSIEIGRLTRHFYATSSCGVCGKASLEALEMLDCPALPRDRPQIKERIIRRLPDRLKAAQRLFGETGGLHAAALFDTSGQLVSVREDVGRHNAVDKLVGEQLMVGAIPLLDKILMVSGRTSFEILQKALRAGLPIVGAIGAPSTLAVDVARQFGMTLLGFIRGNRFNIYAGERRILQG